MNWFIVRPSVSSIPHMEKCKRRGENSCWKMKKCWSGINSVVKLLYRQTDEGLFCPSLEDWWGGENISISRWKESSTKERKEGNRHKKSVWWSQKEWRAKGLDVCVKTQAVWERKGERESGYTAEGYLNTLRAVGWVNLQVVTVFILHREKFNGAAGWKLERADNQWRALIDAWSYAACDTGDK